MSMRRFYLLVLVIIAASCSRTATIQELDTRLSRRQFVNVMSELEVKPPSEKAAILKKHRATEKDLRDFVDKYSKQPALFSETLDSVQAHVLRVRNPH